MLRTFAILLLTPILLCGQVSIDAIFEDIEDPVDIGFAMDTSGSMYPQLEGVRDYVTNFTNALEDSGYSYRIGATTFADSTTTWDFNTLTPGYDMTSDVTEFQLKLSDAGGCGGGDRPEVSLDGIFNLVNNYTWDWASQHVVIMFTDQAFHFYGDPTGISDLTPDDVLTELMLNRIVLYILAGDFEPYEGMDCDSVYEALTEATGGAYFDLPASRYRSLTSTWIEVFDAIVSDICEVDSNNNLCGIKATVSGLTGMELESISITRLASELLVDSSTIDLTGPEYDGLSNIEVVWIINNPELLGLSSTFYTITLSTTERVYEESGELDLTTGVGENSAFLPELSITAYPNPFNSAVMINTPKMANVEIFDIDGHMITELSGGIKVWQPEVLIGSGIYLVRATVGRESVTKRIVYLK